MSRKTLPSLLTMRRYNKVSQRSSKSSLHAAKVLERPVEAAKEELRIPLKEDFEDYVSNLERSQPVVSIPLMSYSPKSGKGYWELICDSILNPYETTSFLTELSQHIKENDKVQKAMNHTFTLGKPIRNIENLINYDDSLIFSPKKNLLEERPRGTRRGVRRTFAAGIFKQLKMRGTPINRKSSDEKERSPSSFREKDRSPLNIKDIRNSVLPVIHSPRNEKEKDYSFESCINVEIGNAGLGDSLMKEEDLKHKSSVNQNSSITDDINPENKKHSQSHKKRRHMSVKKRSKSPRRLISMPHDQKNKLALNNAIQRSATISYPNNGNQYSPITSKNSTMTNYYKAKPNTANIPTRNGHTNNCSPDNFRNTDCIIKKNSFVQERKYLSENIKYDAKMEKFMEQQKQFVAKIVDRHIAKYYLKKKPKLLENIRKKSPSTNIKGAKIFKTFQEPISFSSHNTPSNMATYKKFRYPNRKLPHLEPDGVKYMNFFPEFSNFTPPKGSPRGSFVNSKEIKIERLKKSGQLLKNTYSRRLGSNESLKLKRQKLYNEPNSLKANIRLNGFSKKHKNKQVLMN